jgi:Recombination endonuclease VII
MVGEKLDHLKDAGQLSTCSRYKDKERRRAYQRNFDLKRNYGITIDDYNQMFIDQRGCCAICETPQYQTNKRLHVDHDHVTGKVRGLLCHNCNLTLGRLKENIDVLRKAIRYLEDARTGTSIKGSY